MKPSTLRLLMLCLLALFSIALSAQNKKLINWNQGTDSTYVFEINNKEAEKLVKIGFSRNPMKELLHTHVATFGNKWKDTPSQGHFIHVNIRSNQINYNYVPIMPFQVLLFKEYGLLTLQVVDASGEIREDAKIRIQGGKWRLFDDGINYDKESKTYTINDSWSDKPQRILTVELDKFKAVFDLNKHIVPSWIGSGSNYSPSRPNFYSYMITDKNKYKPHETVRFKSYALTGERKPIKEDLEVWIQTPHYKKIGTVSPYHAGGFAGEIQLHDSLQLKLDKGYNIQLRTKKQRVIANASFYYEDYQLSDVKLETKVKDWRHYYPNTNELEIKMVDTNGLPVLDQKAVITITRRSVEKSYIDLLVAPKNVLTETIKLDNGAPTIYKIPSLLFKDMDCNYTIHVNCVTPDGKKLTSTHNVVFYTSNHFIQNETIGSTIRFGYYNLGVEKNIAAQLYIDDAPPVNIQLPHIEEFKQNVKQYRVVAKDNIAQSYVYTSDIEPQLDIKGGIVKDSLNLQLVNPLELDLSWYVYEGNTLLEKGAGKELDFKKDYIELDITYYLEIFYNMGGKDHVFRKAYVPQKEYLTIDLNMPNRIYPGQTLDSKVKVTDSRERGVNEVDLTAFAYNAELGYNVPELPYYGNTPVGREQRDSYSINKRDMIRGAKFALTHKNYDFWNKLAHLDQLPFYQFTFPSTYKDTDLAHSASRAIDGADIPYHDIFKYTVDTPEGTTEFAPYVMQDGRQVTIFTIELNNIPIYFSWTEQPKTYSFLINNADLEYDIVLRLQDRAIIIDKYCFDAGKKNILSINLNNMPQSDHVRTIMIDNKDKFGRQQFTDVEIKRYSKWISDVEINPNGYVYMTQDKQQIPIFHPTFTNRRPNSVLIGPLKNGYYRNMDSTRYYHQGGYSYKYEDNVIYATPIKGPTFFLFNSFNDDYSSLNGLYLTDKEFQSKIGFRNSDRWNPTTIYLENTKLNIPMGNDTIGVHSVVMRSQHTGRVFMPVYKSQISSTSSRNAKADMLYGIDKMEYGDYDVILLYNDGQYLRYDSVPLLKDTYTELNMNNCVVHPKDSTVSKWLDYQLFANINPPKTPNYEQDRIFYYKDARSFNAANDVQGTVVDEDGLPVIGASVYIKGTKNGTITDMDGKFVIDLHGSENTLVVSYVGYNQKEIEVTRGSTIAVKLEYNNQLLDEVVVVGYGIQKKAHLTGSVQTVHIRGVAAGITTTAQDVIPPPEKMKVTEDTETYDQEAEQQLYQELMQLDGMRTNFSDVGFWQPALVTNGKGEVNFTVTFPDNITRWETVVYAMNRKLKTGTLRHSIKSYKPLMAELKTPSFLVAGDTSNFIAHIRNYSKDKEIEGKVNFVQAGDTLMANKPIHFESSFVDKLLVTAPQTDSLTTSYRFTRNDGYSDGEQRSISIEPIGTKMAEGTLQLLSNGDQIEVSAKKDEEVFITLTGKPIDIYMDATYYLTGYKYACNEQLASKLIGLLNYKLYQKYVDKSFKNDKEVNQIIKRLLDNQNENKLWSWWGNSEYTSYWMSAHILRALDMAKKAGYTVNLDLTKVEYDYMDVSRFRGSSMKDIDILSALVDWGAKQNYEDAIRMFEDSISRIEAREDSLVKVYNKTGLRKDYVRRNSYMKDKLLLLEMRQKLGLEYDTTLITSNLKKDVLGAIRLHDPHHHSYWYYDNDAANIIAYNIIKRDSTLCKYKDAMQMYILSTKRYGWNTYQSANAVKAILPDLLAEASSADLISTVQLSGDDNRKLIEFPFETVLTEGKTINIIKVSGASLIYSAYKIERRTKERIGEAFEVKTSMSNPTLRKGVPITLNIEVKVKQENAEHIIIEVPIPAGCSYYSKIQNYSYAFQRQEVHREYFKEKVSIFCEKLNEGTYNYQVELLPNYTGEYTINPAKVEMMYFPVINANNNIQSVTIEEEE